MALNATIGAETANSYVTVGDADTFFANHYSIAKATAWSALSSTQKENVLMRATQMLDTLRVLDRELGFGAMPVALVAINNYDITIHKQMEFQWLQFPRNIDIDSGDHAFIPQPVKDAQCEQAIHLLTVDEAAIATQLTGIGTESISAGPVHSRVDYRSNGTFIAPLALDLMRPYLRPTTRVERA
jgi:hypothetical protein